MAGLALFADLNRELTGTGVVPLRHRIQSVKIIRHRTDPQRSGDVRHDHRRRDCRRRVRAAPAPRVLMAVTIDDPGGSDGRPTSYSAALEPPAFGTDIARSDDGVELLGQPDPAAARLFIVQSGQGPYRLPRQIPGRVRLVPGAEPCQAWNTLTVGACTELVTPPSAPMFSGWRTVAAAGELSPRSRTSTTFGRSWPVKPDIVLEGGTCWSTPAARSSTSTMTWPS